jgi:hypothetical protein
MFPVADLEDRLNGVTAVPVQTNDSVRYRPGLVEASLDEAILR